MHDFVGSRIALLLDNNLVMILRDDKPGLRFAGMWDFPGGGREGDESPVECAIREVAEELGLRLQQDSIIYQKEVEAMHDPNLRAYFLVANVSTDEVASLILGNEGQKWTLMNIEDFFQREDVVPKLKNRLRIYLNSAD